jgi:hypothetical protein
MKEDSEVSLIILSLKQELKRWKKGVMISQSMVEVILAGY